MKRASEIFSEEERKSIAAAVSEAERQTSGEIVPVVASASGRYDRAEDLFGMAVALLALALVWIFFQDILPVAEDWESGQRLVIGLAPILLIVLGGFLSGAVAATRIPALRLPFIAKKEMNEEVERGAAEAFHRFRVRTTNEGTGVLIYVSLFEHRVRVIGDDAISRKLGQSDWKEIRDLVTNGMRSGRAAEGLVAAVKRCGELLGKHFPAKSGDIDELHNELRLID